MADDAKAEGVEEKPKKKILMLAVIGIVMIAMAGGGFFVYNKFLGPKPAVTEGEGDGHAAVAEEKEGVMFELEPFVVNLTDPKAKRFLKVKIILELDSQAASAKAEALVPKMRDMVIMMLTSLSFEEVMTPEGKIRVRDELLERFNLIMRPDRVRNLYFTDFIIQ